MISISSADQGSEVVVVRHQQLASDETRDSSNLRDFQAGLGIMAAASREEKKGVGTSRGRNLSGDLFRLIPHSAKSR